MKITTTSIKHLRRISAAQIENNIRNEYYLNRFKKTPPREPEPKKELTEIAKFVLLVSEDKKYRKSLQKQALKGTLPGEIESLLWELYLLLPDAAPPERVLKIIKLRRTHPEERRVP